MHKAVQLVDAVLDQPARRLGYPADRRATTVISAPYGAQWGLTADAVRQAAPRAGVSPGAPTYRCGIFLPGDCPAGAACAPTRIGARARSSRRTGEGWRGVVSVSSARVGRGRVESDERVGGDRVVRARGARAEGHRGAGVRLQGARAPGMPAKGERGCQRAGVLGTLEVRTRPHAGGLVIHACHSCITSPTLVRVLTGRTRRTV